MRRWRSLGRPLWGLVISALASSMTEAGDRLGPPMPGRWAFERLVRPEVPGTGAGVANPVDAFVSTRLEREGLEKNAAAGKRTLIRRLSFDLTGIPPSPEEIDTFIADETESAYGTLVDRLLASPRYGERWARHWLDAARFGESQGYEYDRLRENAWPYRDYVIRSLNDDIPYSRFIRQQIAGDLDVGASEGAIAATGFLVAGPWDEANNIQSSATMRARTREDEIEDMVAAVGQTFLGVTVNCARCHDHKFDPIPQVDYYRVAAALAGVRHGDRSAVSASELAGRAAEKVKLGHRLDEADAEIAAIDRAGRRRLPGDVRESAISPWLRWSFEEDENAEGIASRLAGSAAVSGGRLRLTGAGSHLVAGPLPKDLKEKTFEAWARIRDLEQRGGGVISVQSRGGASFDAIVFGESVPRAWLAGSEFFRRSKDLGEVPEQETGPIHVAISFHANGTMQMYRQGQPYGEAYTPTGSPEIFSAQGSEILIGLRHSGASNGQFLGDIDEARVYDRALSDAEIAASHKIGPGGPSLRDILAALTDQERHEREDAIGRHRDLATRIKKLGVTPKVYAANPTDPGVRRVLLRGDVEKPGREVSAGGLSAISKPDPDFAISADATDAQRRRRLADWIADRDNPLTWRAMANRVWHYHFGTGIVATPNDLGESGERPTHPELLDWLACELRDKGSLKSLHRLIVTSDVYRRSSRSNLECVAKDADARLLWRYPPRRLEAEAIRDAMLFVSGDWNLEMYGPSVRPFTVAVFNSNFYRLTDEEGPRSRRRTIYRMNVLSAKDPLLEAFDCPDPAIKTPRRGVTTTPLQALALMNDPFVTRRARSLAERATKVEVGDELVGPRGHAGLSAGAGTRPVRRPRKRSRAVDPGRSRRGMEQVAWARCSTARSSSMSIDPNTLAAASCGIPPPDSARSRCRGCSPKGRRGDDGSSNRPPHHEPKVRRVIQIFACGGVSHVDTFDPKPELARLDGTGDERKRQGRDVLRPARSAPEKPLQAFARHGESGQLGQRPPAEPGDVRGRHDVPPRDVTAKSSNHTPATFLMNSGFTMNGFPSLGAWLSYGLGTENEDLPTFVVLPDPSEARRPAVRSTGRPASCPRTTRASRSAPRASRSRFCYPPNTVDRRRRPGRGGIGRSVRDGSLLRPRPRGRTRRSTPGSVPTNSPAGCRRASPGPSTSGVSRPRLESPLRAGLAGHRGVRPQLPAGPAAGGARRPVRPALSRRLRVRLAPRINWDAHEDIKSRTTAARRLVMDRPVAGLLKDLKSRGLLDDTLVLWTTEFGRTPPSRRGSAERGATTTS